MKEQGKAGPEEAQRVSAPEVLKVELELLSKVEQKRVQGLKAGGKMETAPAAALSTATS